MTTPPDLFVAQHQSLVIIHRALLDNFTVLTGCDVEPERAERAGPMGRFLLAHHDAENAVLFPFLRRSTRMTSEDIGFLDAREREHVVVHDLCERLLAAAGAPHPSHAEIAVVARAIVEAVTPHFSEEERGLTPERLRAMLTPESVVELGREQEAFRARVAPRI